MKSFTQQITANFHFIILLVVGGVLRLLISVSHSYSSDELSAITRLKYSDFPDLIEFGVKKGDMHPAGVQVFEKIWSSLFGTSELALRLPFVLAGIFSVYLIYKIGVKLFSKQSGVISALLLSLTFFPILESELARPYSFGCLFVLLVTTFYIKLNQSESGKQKWKNAIVLGVCFALAMYTHYFALLLVSFMGVTGLLFLKKDVLLQYVVSGLIGIILFLPHLHITIFHLGVEGGLQWLAPPSKLWLFDFLFYVFNESWWLIIGLAVLFIYAIKSKGKIQIKDKKYVWLLMLWFFGIFIVAFVFSYLKTPILKFEVMYFPLPFLFLLIGVPFSKLDTKSFNIVFALLFVLILSTTIFQKELFKNKHFGVLKELAEPMVEWREKYGKENIVTYMNVSSPYYLNYYAFQLGDSLTFNKDLIEYGESQQIYNELLTIDKPYCVVGFSTRNTLPQVFESCKFFYPYIVDSRKYFNSSVFLLSKNKKKESKSQQKKLLAQFNPSQSNHQWKHNQSAIMNDCYVSDSVSIYGPDFTFKLLDLNLKNAKQFNDKYYLKIEVETNVDSDAQLTATLSVKRNQQPLKSVHGDNIWLGKDLEPMINHPKGNSVSFFATSMPVSVKKNDDILIGLWNRNGKPVKIYSISVWLMENIWN